MFRFAHIRPSTKVRLPHAEFRKGGMNNSRRPIGQKSARTIKQVPPSSTGEGHAPCWVIPLATDRARESAALRGLLREHFGFDLPEVESVAVPTIPELT